MNSTMKQPKQKLNFRNHFLELEDEHARHLSVADSEHAKQVRKRKVDDELCRIELESHKTTIHEAHKKEFARNKKRINNKITAQEMQQSNANDHQDLIEANNELRHSLTSAGQKVPALPSIPKTLLHDIREYDTSITGYSYAGSHK